MRSHIFYGRLTSKAMRRNLLDALKSYSWRMIGRSWLLLWIPWRITVESFLTYIWSPKPTAHALADNDFFKTALTDHKTALKIGVDFWWNPKPSCASVLLQHKLATEITLPLVLDTYNRDILGRPAPRATKSGMVQQSLVGSRICVVQCGAGFLSEILVQSGAEVTAIDTDENLIMIARAHWQKMKDVTERPRYLRGSPAELAQQTGTDGYDLVIVAQPSDQVINWKCMLRDSAKLVRNGGCLLVTGPNRNWRSFYWNVIWLEHFLKIASYGSHRFYRFVGTRDIEAMIKKNDISNMRVLSINGSFATGWSSRRFKWKRSNSTDVWYNMVMQKRLDV